MAESCFFAPKSNDDFGLKPLKNGADGRYNYFLTRRLGRQFFVKSLSDSHKTDLLSLQALNKEFRIAFNLDHPNIARYYYFEEDTIFEEYIQGLTLSEMIAQKDVRLQDEEFVAKIVSQIFDAVSYLHSRGILHLDLKPENIMVTDIGQNAKIIDFGCAYSSTDDSTPGYSINYRAPEQVDGTVNTYTDIFQAGRVTEELTALLTQQKKWKKFIAKATATDPSARFANDAEAIAAIPSASKKRRIFPMLLFTAVGVVSIVNVWLLTHRRDAPATSSLPAPERELLVGLPPEAVEQNTARQSAPQQSVPRDIETELSTAIKNVADRHYSGIRTWLENNEPNDSILNELTNRMNHAEEALRQYCRELAASHPDKQDLIESELFHSLIKHSSILMQIYEGEPVL